MARCVVSTQWRVLAMAIIALTVSSPANRAAANPMPVGGAIAAPSAFLDFCDRNPGECHHVRAVSSEVRETPARMDQLRTVNVAVNREISYRKDSYTFGRADYWNIPFIYGDCEDIALLKRRDLIALGWPPSNLLLTLARTETGALHLVLVAVTDKDEYVLDNRRNTVLPWSALQYQWLGRQSRDSETRWVSVGGAASGATGRGAGGGPADE